MANNYTSLTLESRYDPSFYLFPINNARTGYQPVWIPTLLVEPAKRDPNTGLTISGSGVLSLEFYVEDAPNLRAPVAGYDHRGIFNPEFVLFKITVSEEQKLQNLINLDGLAFHQGSPTGPIVSFEDAKDGDYFEFSIKKNQAAALVPYFTDADYYDLSAFEITTRELPPNHYNFIWQASYYHRVLSADNEFKCVDQTSVRLTNLRVNFAHPGEVHKEMVDKTPPLYFSEEALADDPLVRFYRPFADVLQDIFDEHSLLRGINWISKIPAQMIPYLAYLIGWDLPTFPNQDLQSADKIRRAILRNATKLQKLKSSRRAIYELFEIFGYTVDLVNTYFLVNGDGRLDVVAPDETAPKKFAGQSVITSEVCQLEPLIASFSDTGRPFGGLSVPLMYPPKSDIITINAYLVADGSPADATLSAAINGLEGSPDALNEPVCMRVGGSIVPHSLQVQLAGETLLGHASVTIDAKTGQPLSENKDKGLPTIGKRSIGYDPRTNVMIVGFDGSVDFSGGEKMYVFASYERVALTFNPPSLQWRQSNRFDVDFTSKVDQNVDPKVLDYLINFLFKLKAFHSLLRKIIFPVNLTEVYDVTDITAGGANRQKPGTDAGDLQVPPPIIPTGTYGSNIPCADTNLNYKQSDLDLRKAILDGLEEEHAAWKAFDSRSIPPSLKPIIDSLTRVPYYEPTRAECKYNPYGQDRVVTDKTVDLDHQPDNRASVCDLAQKPVPDYSYVGRVKAFVDAEDVLDLTELVRCRPCRLMGGKGIYIITPNPWQVDWGNTLRQRGQQGSRYLGNLYRAYNAPSELIHYTHSPFNHLDDFKKLSYLAIQRPSLDIDKDNWFMPGHRHPYAYALEHDFTHPDYTARPWDDAYSLITCQENKLDQNLLNARIEIIHGEEFLVFDSVQLGYQGNGLVPDISSYGDQEARPFKITHSIYVEQETRPWVSFTGVTETTVACIKPTDSMWVAGLFKSATGVGDYIGGYPADQSVMSIETSAGSGPFTIRFTYGSGILLDPSDPEYRYQEGFRYDCDCNQFDESCGSGSGGSGSGSAISARLGCLLEKYRLPNGGFDFNCDQITVDQTLVLNEKVGTCSTLYDGTIQTSFCMLGNPAVQDGKYPPFGTYRYRDDYGVIYDGMFEYYDDVIDITTAIFSPRVPGQADQGYLTKDEQGRILYMKRGVLVVTRQVIALIPGGYRIVAEGTTTEIKFERINDICGETPCVDNFCYHFDCQVVDDLEILVNGSGGSTYS